MSAAPNSPVVQAINLTVAPEATARPVLRDIQLELRAGESIALIGPSGSGKTTLLRTLSGHLPARNGHIVINGSDLTVLCGKARRRVRRQIGYVAQKHDLVEPLRVHQNVMAGALGRWSTLRALRYLVRPSRTELDEAHAALDAVGLAHKLHEPTAALSGGEQQRVAIARALVQAPRLLIGDEPIASLDPATAQATLELLTGLAAAHGMALICSLHQPELAQRYFSRVLQTTSEGLIRPLDIEEHARPGRRRMA